MWGTRTLGLHRLTRVPVLLMKSTAFGLREGGLRHAGLLLETCDPIIAPLSAARRSCGYSMRADVNTRIWKGWAVKYRHLADIEQTTMHPLFSTGAGLSCCLSRLMSLYARRMGVMMKKRMKIKRIMSASCWTKERRLSTETSLARPHTRGLTVVLTLNAVDSVQHRCL